MARDDRDLPTALCLHQRVSELEAELRMERLRRKSAEDTVRQLHQSNAAMAEAAEELEREAGEMANRVRKIEELLKRAKKIASDSDEQIHQLLGDLMEERSKPPRGVRL